MIHAEWLRSSSPTPPWMGFWARFLLITPLAWFFHLGLLPSCVPCWNEQGKPSGFILPLFHGKEISSRSHSFSTSHKLVRNFLPSSSKLLMEPNCNGPHQPQAAPFRVKRDAQHAISSEIPWSVIWALNVLRYLTESLDLSYILPMEPWTLAGVVSPWSLHYTVGQCLWSASQWMKKHLSPRPFRHICLWDCVNHGASSSSRHHH